MTIFVIFRVSDPAKLGPAIQREFKDNYLNLGKNEWLVSSSDTAQAVALKLGISKEAGVNGNFMVFAMGGYFGRASSEVWEWIRVKAEQTGG